MRLSQIALVVVTALLGLVDGQADDVPFQEPVPSLGCGKKLEAKENYGGVRFKPGETKWVDAFYSEGMRREYKVYVPKKYDPNKPHPLIMAYHQTMKRPQNFQRKTRFSLNSMNPNMIVVYLSAVNGKWDGPVVANKNVSDATYSMDVLNQVKKDLCVDVGRVYGVGHSGGAGLLNAMACNPEQGRFFAAMALVSGSYWHDTKDSFCRADGPQLPMPLWALHGTADEMSRYEGRDFWGGRTPPIGSWVRRWVRRDGCDAEPREERLDATTRSYRFTCGGKKKKKADGEEGGEGVKGMVEYIRVNHHGFFYMDDYTTMDVSPLILKFLARFSRPCNGTGDEADCFAYFS